MTVQASLEIRQSLQLEIVRIQQAYAQGGVDGFERATSHDNIEYNLSNFYYLLADQAGKRIAGDLVAWPDNAERKNGRMVFEIDRLARDADTVKLMAVEAALPDGNRVLVARNLRLLRVFIENIRFVILLFFSVSVVLCLGLALIFSLLSLTRLEKFNIGIRRIMRGDLSQRFATSNSNAEPEELARNLNRMLDVIASLMDDVKRVSDNIAHDLRTPLTRHRNNLVSVKNRLGDSEAESVQELITETDQLLATFNALLRIARIESANRSTKFEALDLAKLLQDVIELYEPLAADKQIGINLQAEGNIEILGDRHLLFQAVANLLDNAIKFTPTGGDISIVLRAGSSVSGVEILQALSTQERGDESNTLDYRSKRYCSLEIIDSGVGVNPDNYKKMFQRFYREEQSRGVHPGNGLGLSMVHAAINLHKGAIFVEDNQPGLIVRLVFLRTPRK
ncbi:MAG: hypothetical protein KJP25_11330 [Gammaproteobacteria bacterium]|nr:hypothetical protein [Gammaproteobacteria bacterium]MBT8151169.1 hypothetical protein [Gammaproteobacteria bacterium]NNL11002.1 hypothetical protein [Pseudomonadales bacterium]